jgi:transcriptional regulator with XRE-family HTH domain
MFKGIFMDMIGKSISFEKSCQSILERKTAYSSAMEISSGQILWVNVTRLMVKKYGEENLSRFARESGIGVATIFRMKIQEGSPKLEMIDKMASVFGVPAWSLICAESIEQPSQFGRSLLDRFESLDDDMMLRSNAWHAAMDALDSASHKKHVQQTAAPLQTDAGGKPLLPPPSSPKSEKTRSK